MPSTAEEEEEECVEESDTDIYVGSSHGDSNEEEERSSDEKRNLFEKSLSAEIRLRQGSIASDERESAGGRSARFFGFRAHPPPCRATGGRGRTGRRADGAPKAPARPLFWS